MCRAAGSTVSGSIQKPTYPSRLHSNLQAGETLCILIIVGLLLMIQLPRREGGPIHMGSRTASLLPDAPAQRYNTFIQSCFCRHPEAGSYYQQLIDFILSRQAGVRSVERAL